MGIYGNKTLGFKGRRVYRCSNSYRYLDQRMCVIHTVFVWVWVYVYVIRIFVDILCVRIYQQQSLGDVVIAFPITHLCTYFVS